MNFSYFRNSDIYGPRRSYGHWPSGQVKDNNTITSVQAVIMQKVLCCANVFMLGNLNI